MDQDDITIQKCNLHDLESQIYCKNINCQYPLSCFKCIKEHSSHLDDIENFLNNKKILHQRIEENQELCQKLCTELKILQKETKQLLFVLIKGVTLKFTINNLEYFNNLNFVQQNELFYQQLLFEYKIKEQLLQEMKNSFFNFKENILDQIVNLKLEALSYYQIDENDIQQSDVKYWQGVESYQNHQLDDALINLNNALIYNPKSLNALSLKAETLRLQRKFDDAIEFFDKALAIDDKHVFSLFGKGESLRLQKKLDDSITWYNKALDIDSQHSGSWYGRGEALRMKKQFTEAFKCFNEVLNKQENQNNPIFLSSQGACLVGLGKLEQAEKYLNQAYTLDPNNKFCETWLAKCKAQKQT